MKIKTIFVDMDGVLADFISSAFRANGSTYDAATYPRQQWEIADVLGVGIDEFWAKIDADPDFWRNLTPYPWFRDLLDEADESGCEVRILTTPSKHSHSFRGKREWLSDLGIHHDLIMCGSSADKALLAGPDRLLIDDSDKNVSMFRKAGGAAILFPQVWNANHPFADDPMGHVVEQLGWLVGPPRQILGLAGFARSGKDTAAQALTDAGWTRVAFADGVREALLSLDPLIEFRTVGLGIPQSFRLKPFVAGCQGWEWAKKTEDVRRLLQRMGTEAGRNIHGPNCWIDLAKRKIDALAGNVVITDVRFANEAQAIRDWGGKVVRIDRPGVGPANDHASERLDFEPDATIANDGTIEQLHAKVIALAGMEVASA